MLVGEGRPKCSILPVVIGGRSRQWVGRVQFVIQRCKLLSIQEVQFLGCRTPREGARIVDGVAPVRALLGSNDDDTVGTTRTIDGGGRNVLQHFYRLNVCRIQEGQRVQLGVAARSACLRRSSIVVDNLPVNDIQRFVASRDAVAATDTDIAQGPWLSAGGDYVQTSHSPLQGTLDRGILLAQHLAVNTCDGAGQLQTLLLTIAHYHHFVQTAGIVDELYVYRFRSIVDVYLLREVANELDRQSQRQLDVRHQTEVSIHICDSTQFLA